MGCQGALRHPHGAHAVVNPAGPESSLSNLEAPPFAQKNAGYWNSNIPGVQSGKQDVDAFKRDRIPAHGK